MRDAGLEYSDEDELLDILEVLRPRAETLKDFAEHPYFFSEAFSYTGDAQKKLKGGQKYLEDLEREFARLDSFDEDSVDDMLHDYVQAQSVGLGKVLQPLRAALTGTTNSPGINEVVSILGRRRVLGRIGRALTAITEGLPDDKPQKEDQQKTDKGEPKDEKTGKGGKKAAAA